MAKRSRGIFAANLGTLSIVSLTLIDTGLASGRGTVLSWHRLKLKSAVQHRLLDDCTAVLDIDPPLAAHLPQVASCHLGNRSPGRYRFKMSDAAPFIAPALLVAYLAVGCLLVWGGALRR